MGFLGSLWEGFTGAGAQKALNKGLAQGTAALGEGRNAATGAITASGQEARGYLQPYREQGALANRAYGASLGLYDDAERDAVQDSYLGDKLRDRQRMSDAKRQGWAFNSRGGYGTAVHALADAENNYRHWRDYQNQLEAAGQQGQHAATTTAGIAQNEGNALAGVHTGYGQGLASLYGQHGQQSAANANTGFQNLLGVAGLGLKTTGWGGWGNNLSKSK